MSHFFKRLGLLATSVFVCAAACAQETISFNQSWRFHKGDVAGGQSAALNTASWRAVTLPHDWSIEGPFSEEWASATGFLPGGIGWYQKTFTAPESWKGKQVFIYFDGVYKNSSVWLNGHLLGNRPNGFIAFQYELSKYLKPGGKNVISVKADHSQFADSRWYTGSGIYRNVYLFVKNPVHIPTWGVQFTTPEVSATEAKASVNVRLVNRQAAKAGVTIQCKLTDAGGRVVSTASKQLQAAAGDSVLQQLSLIIKSPQLWSVEQPNLYQLTVDVLSGGKITDHFSDAVGIRSIRFDADQGFFLNGKNMKLKGVCIHDDAGALGVAVPEGVWLRRLKTLKEGGCNSLRLSHNPHADYLYKLADQLGFLVMDEAFDEWEVGKNKWVKGWNVGTPSHDGYHEYFKQWSAIDTRDMILRGFNHPSIIMWSIGNEIDYPNDPYTSEVLNTGRNPQIFGRGYLSDHPPVTELSELSRKLAATVRKYDTSRPVTAALAGVVMSNTTSYPENLDVVGYNYQEYRYPEDHQKYPKRFIYGSENGMQLSAWNAVDSNQYVSAQYLWTGIDYLGEAGRWPERSNRAGLLDLAGFRKPEYYFRQSLWADKPMVYIGTAPVPKSEDRGIWSHKRAEPNWNYNAGEKVRVNCFTNCDEAELFLNGKSLGRQPQNSNRIVFWDIDYQPGELRVVGYKRQSEQAEYSLKTSGRPFAIRATAEQDDADKKSGLAHVIVQIVDEAGIPVYDAENEVTVDVQGKARMLGLESGSSSSHEDYQSNKRKVMHGKLLAYVQSDKGSGTVKVILSSPGLQSQTINLEQR